MAETEQQIGVSTIEEAFEVVDAYRVALTCMAEKRGILDNSGQPVKVQPEDEILLNMLSKMECIEDILQVAIGGESTYLSNLRSNCQSAGTATEAIRRGLDLEQREEHPNF